MLKSLIGRFAALLTDTVQLLRMRAAGGRQGLERQLDDAIQQLVSDTTVSLPQLAMVVNGDALSYILRSDEDASAKCSTDFRQGTDEVSNLTQKWLTVAARCSTVIACRVVPQQKADIVRMVKQGSSPEPMTLAVGDGANDVGMIKAASVGIGISGREGQQAANASDYSISQFCFLKRLLLLHGYWDTVRMAKVVQYSFYKVSIPSFLISSFLCHHNHARSDTNPNPAEHCAYALLVLLLILDWVFGHRII